MSRPTASNASGQRSREEREPCAPDPPQCPHHPSDRAEIARSDKPTGVLARRYGVSTETIRKWRKRGPDDCLDHSAKPHSLPWKATGGGARRGLRAAPCHQLRPRRPHLRRHPLPSPPRPPQAPPTSPRHASSPKLPRRSRNRTSGRFATINELVTAEKINSSYVSRVLRLTLLAPDIVEAILDGRQIAKMTLPALMPLEVEWCRQQRCL